MTLVFDMTTGTSKCASKSVPWAGTWRQGTSRLQLPTPSIWYLPELRTLDEHMSGSRDSGLEDDLEDDFSTSSDNEHQHGKSHRNETRPAAQPIFYGQDIGKNVSGKKFPAKRNPCSCCYFARRTCSYLQDGKRPCVRCAAMTPPLVCKDRDAGEYHRNTRTRSL